MGYEVLGGHTPGRRSDALEVPPAGDVEVTDLSDLTSASGTPADPPGPGGPRRLAGLTHLPPGRGRTAVVAVIALVAGLAAGIWSASAHQDAAPSAAERARLAVLATTAGSTSLREDPDTRIAVARLEVQVVNLGVGAVSVLASPTASAAPRPGQTITFLPPAPTIGAGQVQRVTVLVSVDCRRNTSVVPTLSVRSTDGVVHGVPVKDDQLAEYRMAAQEVCHLSDAREQFVASLTGSVAAPTLVLTNSSDQPIAVSVSTESSIRPRPGELIANSSSGGLEPVPADGSGLGISFATTPDLPLRLPAGATQRVAVRLSVAHCLSQKVLSGSGGLALAALPINGNSPIAWATGYVDLGPALGAVVAQVCQEQGSR